MGPARADVVDARRRRPRGSSRARPVAIAFAYAVALAAASGALAAANAPAPPQETIPFEGGRFVVARAADATCVIALQGTITRSASFAFETATTRADALGCANPWLLLESPGGSLDDGIELGKAVRLKRLRTLTRETCASACALIFLGGVERLLVGPKARIGFHQAARTHEREDKTCEATRQDRSFRAMRRYLGWLDPAHAERLMDTIMRTPCTSIAFIAGEPALELGVATKLAP
jgi:ATP-dependent protease ClpP protease subunit